mgnify:CR=1 FL=1
MPDVVLVVMKVMMRLWCTLLRQPRQGAGVASIRVHVQVQVQVPTTPQVGRVLLRVPPLQKPEQGLQQLRALLGWPRGACGASAAAAAAAVSLTAQVDVQVVVVVLLVLLVVRSMLPLPVRPVGRWVRLG